MNKTLNLYNTNSEITKNDEVYKNFNNFIFSNERNIFNKLYSRIKFYELTKHLLGDIVECGVFKGSGIATWIKILEMNEPNSLKKVIGFDFFNKEFVNKLQDEVEKELMKQVFSRCINLQSNDISLEGVTNKILNLGSTEERFELIGGDISQTSKKFAQDRPGFRISILYLDLDLGEPTYNTLVNFWDRIVTGGIIVFDEYAYHKWSESNGVDKFIKEKKLNLISTGIKTPTAYLIKE